MLISPSHQFLCIPSCLFPLNFPTNAIYTFEFSAMRATFLDYNILYVLMFLIKFGVVYEI
jgi:hypothetical protein